MTSSEGNIELRRLNPYIGAEVHNLDIEAGLTDEQEKAIVAALFDHSLLIFRDQHLSPGTQVQFSELFGENDVHIYDQYLDPDFPQLIRLSNMHGEKGVVVDNYWHADLTYYPEPTGGAVLYAHEVPRVGGDTLYASLINAYDRLPDKIKKELNGKEAVHSHDPRPSIKRPTLSDEQKPKAPDSVHPVVCRHPVTGRRILFVNEGFTSSIVGLSEDASEELLQYLFKHSTDEEFVYRHKWRKGDVLIWDNRAVVHSATPWDTSTEKRHLTRTTIKGERPEMASPY
ncbi:TauD/TfdA dioxygenase family protein [Lentisalinibacter orientalis]|uniref:TauD/TfdA dioxygenase family protein n=1 Tax=Lentisalinibacter orientalis TaxID=2992241 RepID=UPI0038632132